MNVMLIRETDWYFLTVVALAPGIMSILGGLFFFDAHIRCEKKLCHVELTSKSQTMPTLEAAAVQSRYLIPQRLVWLIGCGPVSTAGWYTLWESTPHPVART